MDTLEILKTLVSIPSVNPMGRDLSGPEYYETRVSDWLCGFFAERDIAHERIEVVPGRSNVVARVDAGADRPTVILDAHQDTVPVDGMTIDPFDPVVRDVILVALQWRLLRILDRVLVVHEVRLDILHG